MYGLLYGMLSWQKGILSQSCNSILTLWSLRMTSIQFLLTISPLKVTRKGSDHRLKKLLIVKQILLVSALQNVWRTVWRILMLMIGCKGLKCSRRVNNQKQSLRRILEVISLYKSQNYFSDGFVNLWQNIFKFPLKQCCVSKCLQRSQSGTLVWPPVRLRLFFSLSFPFSILTMKTMKLRGMTNSLQITRKHPSKPQQV